MANPTRGAYWTWSRFDLHALGGDRLGVEAVGTDLGDHAVGFAKPTHAFGPHLAFGPIPPGKMENSK